MIFEGAGYVAMGSSFAAGPGIAPAADRRAGRSAANYPHLVAAALGLRLTDVTFSGATTAHLLDAPQRGRPPQIAAVRPDTRLVTVTAGGNDAGYIGSLIKAGALPGPFRRSARIPEAAAFDAVAASLARVVRAVRAHAPGARVLLVDYLPVLDPATSGADGLPLTPEQARRARAAAAALTSAFRRAAGEGAEFVEVADAARGHGHRSPAPWTTGFARSWPFRGAVPYHPTGAGMEALAALVVDRLAA
ncbi:SGNH/GDSL hydrolase family protein [Actinomadura parmotrematis]|uniref:SGNH/GDSL hydrolase family protein n=1 Tax=Actinomadura parmotrematis TaxID=2864039 RepID=A0ABS7G2S6_9ACTN|nr:SGNH/GDSL hydrolase family protein [Actinomadura parmotrematis]MBW8487023.1 SGNH/GDSL hydrolase family protein [Actinomadura parmotrematis]